MSAAVAFTPPGVPPRVLFDGIGDEIEPSDILEIINGVGKIHDKQLHLYLAKASEGGSVLCHGQFTLKFVEHPNMSSLTWNPDPNSSAGWVSSLPARSAQKPGRSRADRALLLNGSWPIYRQRLGW